jgi:hypothetical protein
MCAMSGRTRPSGRIEEEAKDINLLDYSSRLDPVAGPDVPTLIQLTLSSYRNIAYLAFFATGRSQRDAGLRVHTDAPAPEDGDRRRGGVDQHSYNTNNLLQLVGNGPLTDAQKSALTEEARRNLAQ